MIDKIVNKIDQLIREKSYVVVAIDGQAASGKTTLAKQINQYYQSEIIHMDDYFLRPEQRTQERLKEVSGNIDYERFQTEVIANLSEDVIEIHPFNCKTSDYDQSRKIIRTPLIIIEGAYSMRPSWQSYYDLKVLLLIDPELQKERIISRNGVKLANRFFIEWIPKENEHISKHKLENRADIIVQISK